MTNPVTSLSREELAALYEREGEFCAHCDSGDDHARCSCGDTPTQAALLCELVRRLRDDGERIERLTAMCDARDGVARQLRGDLGEANARIRELESQLAAANGKVDAIKVGDRVRHASDLGGQDDFGVGVVREVNLHTTTRNVVDVRFANRSYSIWCDPRELTRLPPEPAVRDFDPFAPIETLPADIQRDIATERGLAPEPAVRIRRSEDSNGEPRYEVLSSPPSNSSPTLTGSEQVVREAWGAGRGTTPLSEPSKPVATGCDECKADRDTLREQLRALRAGVDDLRKTCEVVASATQVPEAVRQEMAFVAAKLRSLL